MISVNLNEQKQTSGYRPEILEGLAKCKVIAINPTKEELGKMGINTEKEPVYTYKKEDRRGIRVTFWLEIVEPNALAGRKVPWTFFMSDKSYFCEKDGTQMVIDEFGRFSKITPDDFTQRKIPTTKTGVL